jgi:hypothetical protein
LPRLGARLGQIAIADVRGRANLLDIGGFQDA